MKEQLLSIADYLDSLEQRIAALESANVALQETNVALQNTICDLRDKLETPVSEPAQTSPLQSGLGGVSPSAPLGGVSNIRQAISLGDRFLFQRELFANNGELMQKTLDELDACANLSEAEQYITRFSWDPESPTCKLFLNVLKRRF